MTPGFGIKEKRKKKLSVSLVYSFTKNNTSLKLHDCIKKILRKLISQQKELQSGVKIYEVMHIEK